MSIFLPVQSKYPFVPYVSSRPSLAESRQRLAQFESRLRGRRSVREFSPDPVPDDLLQGLVRIAAGAPSGANRQPWRFVVVKDPATKSRIRLAAEKEEKESYDHRMPPDWLEALAPLGTDWHKPFLEIAPALIVVFKKDHEIVNGRKLLSYYPNESVGIACGFLIAALHDAGLVTLTHTPSPMNFLGEILDARPGEKAFLLLPVGYPAGDAMVPDLTKKKLEDVLTWR